MIRQLILLSAVVAALQTPAGVTRIAGIDPGSAISYALLSVEGHLVGAETPGKALPRLTAQCTKDLQGKLRFELLVDFGDPQPLVYIAPFKPTADQPFAPPVQKSQITMEFLGYTRVKPVKRQFTTISGLSGEWMYGTPGMNSTNMEQVAFYLQYLRALPTLRLTLPGQGAAQVTAEWDTTKWQTAVRAEPLCGASGL